jgi:hypothetical protein
MTTWLLGFGLIVAGSLLCLAIRVAEGRPVPWKQRP